MKSMIGLFVRMIIVLKFAPGFLEYIDVSLEKYKYDESVMGVTGYSYPVEWDINPECNAFKNAAVFPMLGNGIFSR